MYMKLGCPEARPFDFEKKVLRKKKEIEHRTRKVGSYVLDILEKKQEK